MNISVAHIALAIIVVFLSEAVLWLKVLILTLGPALTVSSRTMSVLESQFRGLGHRHYVKIMDTRSSVGTLEDLVDSVLLSSLLVEGQLILDLTVQVEPAPNWYSKDIGNCSCDFLTQSGQLCCAQCLSLIHI